ATRITKNPMPNPIVSHGAACLSFWILRIRTIGQIKYRESNAPQTIYSAEEYHSGLWVRQTLRITWKINIKASTITPQNPRKLKAWPHHVAFPFVGPTYPGVILSGFASAPIHRFLIT